MHPKDVFQPAGPSNEGRISPMIGDGHRAALFLESEQNYFRIPVAMIMAMPVEEKTDNTAWWINNLESRRCSVNVQKNQIFRANVIYIYKKKQKKTHTHTHTQEKNI